MFGHSLEGFLRFVFIGREKLEYDMLIRNDLLIERFLLLGHILVELPQFAQLVLIVLDLRVEEETSALFLEDALFLLS